MRVLEFDNHLLYAYEEPIIVPRLRGSKTNTNITTYKYFILYWQYTNTNEINNNKLCKNLEMEFVL